MAIIPVTPDTPSERVFAALQKRRVEEERGRPLTPQEEGEVVSGVHRCLTLEGPTSRLHSFLHVKGKKAYAFMTFRRQIGHFPHRTYNRLDAFTVPSHRGEGLQKELLHSITARTGRKAAQALASGSPQTRAALARLEFAVRPYRCVERIIGVDRARTLRDLVPAHRSEHHISNHFYNRDDLFTVGRSQANEIGQINQLQQRLTHTVPCDIPAWLIRQGIEDALANGDLYGHGWFWSLRHHGVVVGTAKVLAEVDPTRDGWVLYLRHCVIHPNFRRIGLLGPFTTGILALALRELPPATSPVVVRSFLPEDDRVMAAFRQIEFRPVPHRLAELDAELRGR